MNSATPTRLECVLTQEEFSTDKRISRHDLPLEDLDYQSAVFRDKFIDLLNNDAKVLSFMQRFGTNPVHTYMFGGIDTRKVMDRVLRIELGEKVLSHEEEFKKAWCITKPMPAKKQSTAIAHKISI